MTTRPTVIPLRPESPRYGPALGFVGGLFTGPSLWTGFAGYLAHRGWSGAILDPDGATWADRVRAIADWARSLPAPPILIGHALGVGLAIDASRSGAVRGLVGLAPVVSGDRSLRQVGTRLRAVAALALRRPVGLATPAREIAGSRTIAGGPRAGLLRDLRPEPASLVLGAGRRRPIEPLPVPTLLVGGASDVRCGEMRALAASLDAELVELAGGGPWLPCDLAWQEAVAVVHRWAVRGLPAGALDLYADAMADRDAGDETDG